MTTLYWFTVSSCWVTGDCGHTCHAQKTGQVQPSTQGKAQDREEGWRSEGMRTALRIPEVGEVTLGTHSSHRWTAHSHGAGESSDRSGKVHLRPKVPISKDGLGVEGGKTVTSQNIICPVERSLEPPHCHRCTLHAADEQGGKRCVRCRHTHIFSLHTET